MIYFCNAWKRLMGRPINFLFLFVLPVVICLLTLTLLAEDPTFILGVEDRDQSDLSLLLRQELSRERTLVKVDSEGADFERLLEEGSVDAILVLPENLTEQLLQTGQIRTVYYQMGDSAEKSVQLHSVRTLMRWIEEQAHGHVEESAVVLAVEQGMKERGKTEYLYVSDHGGGVENARSSFGYLAFCLLFLMGLSTSLIVEDRDAGVADRLMSSPANRFNYYGQYLLAFLSISIIQVSIVIHLLPLLAPVSFGSRWSDTVRMSFISSLFALVSISIGMLINRYARDRKTSRALTSMITMPMVLLGGCFWPLEQMNPILRFLGSLMPTSWFMDAADTVLYTSSLFHARDGILLLSGTALILFTLVFIPKYRSA